LFPEPTEGSSLNTRDRGGAADPSPPEDFSFMYGRSFEDPDGHGWGVNYMDVEAFKAQFATENA